MKRKILCESLQEFRQLKEEKEPLAVAVLGAPAGGKSFTMQTIAKTIKDARISDTLTKGENLSIDKLRDEFRSKNPHEQMRGFVRAYYYLKDKAKEDPKQYTNWFNDIKSLWNDKLNKLITSVKIVANDNDLTFDGEPASKSMNKMINNKSFSTSKIITQLDRYTDYKRVVRYFQGERQQQAIDKQYNLTYDESGDEPEKILNGLRKLHKSGYVTDVFLIHPENVATNIIQNYYRVLTGLDGGRDASEAIINAYLEIEKNKKKYTNDAEDNLKTTTQTLQNPTSASYIHEPIIKANVEDDDERGDKSIDVFTEVSPMKPIRAFNFFNKKLEEEEKPIFLALLKYRMLTMANLPENAKAILERITKSLNNIQAFRILNDAAESKKYVFKYGGITPKFLINAKSVLK